MIDLGSVRALGAAAVHELLAHLTTGALEVPDTERTSRCKRGDRCLARIRCDQKEWHGAPASRPLCDTCERAVAVVLTEVPSLYLDLENALPPGAAPASSGGSRPKITGSPLGINGRAGHLQESIHQLLTVWEDAVRDTANLSPVVRQDEDPWESRRPEQEAPRTKRRPRPSVETVAAAKLLHTYLTAWVVHQPIEYAITRTTADPDNPKAKPTDEPQYVDQAGWEAAASLLDWKAQVRATIGVTTPAIKRPEPCMYCEVKAVVEEAGHAGYDQIRCQSCNRTWPRHEYLAKVRGFEPYLRTLANKPTAPRSR